MPSDPSSRPDPMMPSAPEAIRLRAVRSFGSARGRITRAQQRAYERDFPRYALAYQARPIAAADLFGRSAPLVLEIGFGMGETTAALAAAHPNLDFLAVEVFGAGIGSLSRLLAAQSLGNVRIVQHDAVEVVREMLLPACLAAVHIFFPDPWPKARHHKRRLVAPPFVAELSQRLQPGGYLHCATDWQPYAEQMLQVLSSEPRLRNRNESYAADSRNPLCERPATKFHARGRRLGHGVWDLVFERL